MISYLSKFKKLISKSKPSQEDQSKFLTLFKGRDEKEFKDLIAFLKKDPEKVKIINRVYNAKKKALKNRDRRGWETILKEEYKILENLK